MRLLLVNVCVLYRVEVHNPTDATEQGTYSALQPFPTILQTASQTSIPDTLKLVRSNNRLQAWTSCHCAGSWLPHASSDAPDPMPSVADVTSSAYLFL